MVPPLIVYIKHVYQHSLVPRVLPAAQSPTREEDPGNTCNTHTCTWCYGISVCTLVSCYHGNIP